jgi:thiamine transport system substrate-binding protein
MPRRSGKRVLMAALFLLAACGSDHKTAANASASSGSSDTRGEHITLVTHDSFVISDEVLKGFEDRTGITVAVLKGGDAGAMVNQAILTKDHPQGDVLYGVDNTLLSRAVDAGLFEPYDSPARSTLDPAFDLDAAQHRVTPVDYSDVCVNVDRTAFGGPGQAPPPANLEDLLAPEYKGRLVVENPATSSPGLAFLLATVARFGDPGYLDYWTKLRANGVKVVDGWEQAYNDSFTLGGGGGDKPLVVSYATSPPADVAFASPAKDTTDVGTVTDGCYRQIEFVGVLRGTKHQAAARAFVDFMASPEEQADLPLSMFVFPVRAGTPLPDVFDRFAARVAHPYQLPPDQVTAKRDQWIAAWTSTVIR